MSICSTRVLRVATRARVMWTCAAPHRRAAPRGAALRRACMVGRVGAAWVTHRRQPCAEALGGQPVGVVLAGQELQTDRRIQMPEQSDRPGEDAFEVLPQLLSARRLLNCPARSSSTRWNNSKQSSLRTSDRCCSTTSRFRRHNIAVQHRDNRAHGVSLEFPGADAEHCRVRRYGLRLPGSRRPYPLLAASER